ncbi:MAG: class I SAM-dependent methyltransferase [Williamsia sp.]|nr:class I SAM-dependent methyltransferase [Williamsia sp.]
MAISNFSRPAFNLLICLLLQTLVACAQSGAGAATATSPYTFGEPSRDGTGKFYMGREIAAIMGAGGASWLDRNSRQQEENTNLAISKFPLTPSSKVADIGAGSGYYTFKVATKIPDGKLYAVEIQDEMIRLLEENKSKLNNSNVEIVKGGEQSPNLPDSSVDLAFMVDVYHELLYPREMLQNIRKALKPTGKLLLLEYKMEDPSVAIKKLHKMSVAQVTKELAANGFTLSYKGDFLPLQHILVFDKK